MGYAMSRENVSECSLRTGNRRFAENEKHRSVAALAGEPRPRTSAAERRRWPSTSRAHYPFIITPAKGVQNAQNLRPFIGGQMLNKPGNVLEASDIRKAHSQNSRRLLGRSERRATLPAPDVKTPRPTASSGLPSPWSCRQNHKHRLRQVRRTIAGRLRESARACVAPGCLALAGEAGLSRPPSVWLSRRNRPCRRPAVPSCSCLSRETRREYPSYPRSCQPSRERPTGQPRKPVASRLVWPRARPRYRRPACAAIRVRHCGFASMPFAVPCCRFGGFRFCVKLGQQLLNGGKLVGVGLCMPRAAPSSAARASICSANDKGAAGASCGLGAKP